MFCELPKWTQLLNSTCWVGIQVGVTPKFILNLMPCVKNNVRLIGRLFLWLSHDTFELISSTTSSQEPLFPFYFSGRPTCVSYWIEHVSLYLCSAITGLLVPCSWKPPLPVTAQFPQIGGHGTDSSFLSMHSPKSPESNIQRTAAFIRQGRQKEALTP